MVAAERNDFRMTGYNARQLVTDPITGGIHRLDQLSNTDNWQQDIRVRQLRRLAEIFPHKELDQMKGVFSPDVAADFCGSLVTLTKPSGLETFNIGNVTSANIYVFQDRHPTDKPYMPPGYNTPYSIFNINISGKTAIGEETTLTLVYNTHQKLSRLTVQVSGKSFPIRLKADPMVMKTLEDLSAKLRAKVIANEMDSSGDKIKALIQARFSEPHAGEHRWWRNLYRDIRVMKSPAYERYRLMGGGAQAKDQTDLTGQNSGLTKDMTVAKTIVGLVDEHAKSSAELRTINGFIALCQVRGDIARGEEYIIDLPMFIEFAKFLPDEAFQKLMTIVYDILPTRIIPKASKATGVGEAEEIITTCFYRALDIGRIETATGKQYPDLRRKASLAYAKVLLDVPNNKFMQALDVSYLNEKPCGSEMLTEGAKRIFYMMEILGISHNYQAMTPDQKESLDQLIGFIYAKRRGWDYPEFKIASNLLAMLLHNVAEENRDGDKLKDLLDIYRGQTSEYLEYKGIFEPDRAIERIIEATLKPRMTEHGAEVNSYDGLDVRE